MLNKSMVVVTWVGMALQAYALIGYWWFELPFETAVFLYLPGIVLMILDLPNKLKNECEHCGI